MCPARCVCWHVVGVHAVCLGHRWWVGGATCSLVDLKEALGGPGSAQMKYSLLLPLASWRDGSSCRAASALSANSVPLASLVW